MRQRARAFPRPSCIAHCAGTVADHLPERSGILHPVPTSTFCYVSLHLCVPRHASARQCDRCHFCHIFVGFWQICSTRCWKPEASLKADCARALQFYVNNDPFNMSIAMQSGVNVLLAQRAQLPRAARTGPSCLAQPNPAGKPARGTSQVCTTQFKFLARPFVRAIVNVQI